MNKVIINGREVFSTNKAIGDINISNGKVFVDGKQVVGTKEPIINVVISGYVVNLNVENSNEFTMLGNTGQTSTKNGDITIFGDVYGSIENKNGNITCNDVYGSEISTKNGTIKPGHSNYKKPPKVNLKELLKKFITENEVQSNTRNDSDLLYNEEDLI